MTEPTPSGPPLVVVTGANGFVGSRTCAALADRGATVRAVVRRSGSAPSLDRVEERVGDFSDPEVAADVLRGASAVVTTVHPMGSDVATQRRIGVEGTRTMARAARDAGVGLLVHVSTTSVYDRGPHVGDLDEGSAPVGDDDGPYALTKRDTDAALAGVEGLTRVVVRPPAILGPGDSSIWNTLRPRAVRDNESARRVNGAETFPWVHVDDLAGFLAEVASGRTATSVAPERGPVAGACTVVNLGSGPARVRDYYETVTGALGVAPVWQDGPAWTGSVLAHRARRWGWEPTVDLTQAFAELADGLRGQRRPGSVQTS